MYSLTMQQVRHLNQGVIKAGSLWWPPRRNQSIASDPAASVTNDASPFLVCGCITPISASLVPWPHPWVSVFLEGQQSLDLGLTLIQYSFILTWWHLQRPHFYFFFFCHCVACGILVPQPGIEPMPPELGVQSLTHWTSREESSPYF